MDIQINTKALCEQIQEVLLDKHPVLFIRIEPKDTNAHTIEVLVPDTDAEFGLIIHPYKSVEVWRCNEDPASIALLDWTLEYMLTRGYQQVAK